jgi:hypothetical protein
MQATKMQSWQVVALVLEKALNQLPPNQSQEKLTVFHSRKVPGISIYDYLARLQYSGCSDSCFVAAFIYIDRILQKNPDISLSQLCIHRLILASVLLAIKFNDDIYYDNAFYAKMGGISLEEMNYLEVGILSHIQFDLYIQSQVYLDYANELRSHCPQLVQPTYVQPMETDNIKEKVAPSIPSNASIETTPSSVEFQES